MRSPEATWGNHSFFCSSVPPRIMGKDPRAFTAKATPTTADFLVIEDAADSNNKKSITIGSLPSAGAFDEGQGALVAQMFG